MSDPAGQGPEITSAATTREEASRDAVIADLMALVMALDERVPHIERIGETLIARDAAALKARALERLAALRDGRG
jgi:collagenase-like PrtC family protease